MNNDNLREEQGNDDLVNSNGISDAWLNFTLYFPQFLYKTKRNPAKSFVCDHFTFKQRLTDNENSLGGDYFSNKFLANGYEYQTDFIEVDKEDIVEIFKYTEDINKTLYFNNQNITSYNLKGRYKSADDNNPNRYYFFKGLTNNVNSFLNLILKKII